MKSNNSRGLITVLLLLTLCVAAMASGYQGTYRARLTLPNDAKIEYILGLQDHGEARLEVKRSGSVRSSQANLRTYGDLVHYLEENEKVEQRGEWEVTDGTIIVRFDRLSAGGDSFSFDTSMELDVDGNDARVVERSTWLYGSGPRIVFSRDRGRSNDLLTGLAIVAAGALLINAVSHDSKQSHELDLTTGGTGTMRFDSGDVDVVEQMKIRLEKNGTFTIELKGSFAVAVSGRWTRTSEGYDLRFENGLFDRARQRTTGSGSITMDRGGFVGRVRLSPWFTETRTGGNLSFRAARG